MNNKKITMNEIAKLVGVSQATVSRAINAPEKVKPYLREKIYSYIEKYNFLPNENAKSMRGVKSKILGLILFDLSNQFYLETIKYAEKVARKIGYTLILMNSEKDSKLELENIKILLSRNVEGILIAPVDNNNLKFLKETTSVPFVVINNFINNYPCVYTSTVKGGEIACDFLIKNNHKKIAYIGNLSNQTTEKFQGILKSFKKNNLSLNFLEKINFDTSKMDKIQLENYFSKNTFSSTGIIASNDEVAYLFLQSLEKIDKDFLKTMILVGFDNTIISSLLNFSSIEQPIEELIEKSIEILFSKKNTSLSVELIPKLIIRN